MKEVRRIHTDRVRGLCIRNQYYTMGTNVEYGHMFDMCGVENPDINDFYTIAVDIWEHSEKEKFLKSTGLSEYEMIKCVMFELANDCTTIHFED